jgi:hypothetical protein
MKGTENTRIDMLSKKLGYKKKQRIENSFIFRKNRNDLVLNKQQLVSIIYVNSDPFTS